MLGSFGPLVAVIILTSSCSAFLVRRHSQGRSSTPPEKRCREAPIRSVFFGGPRHQEGISSKEEVAERSTSTPSKIT